MVDHRVNFQIVQYKGNCAQSLCSKTTQNQLQTLYNWWQIHIQSQFNALTNQRRGFGGDKDMGSDCSMHYKVCGNYEQTLKYVRKDDLSEFLHRAVVEFDNSIVQCTYLDCWILFGYCVQLYFKVLQTTLLLINNTAFSVFFCTIIYDFVA